ncbi:MAG TPA: spermidine synthase [Candidatus Dormibacteraeota bacterium]|nr:spermidine synthase [Candidatus Dormibacteraeota bacterium]
MTVATAVRTAIRGGTAPVAAEPGPSRLRLLLSSFLMLFTELALIRWLGSNVLYLSFFSNFVLLGSFLGIGAGFLRSRARRDLSGWAPMVLAALVVLVVAFPVTVRRSSRQLIFFGAGNATAGIPAWIALPAIFIAVAAVMTCIGEGVGRNFRRFPPLVAYRLDILGSLAGIVAFSALSFLWAPPLAWGAVVVALMVVLHGSRRRLLLAASMLTLLVLLGVESFTPRFSWSPYYKVTQVRYSPTNIEILVNGIPHQDIGDVHRDAWLRDGYRQWPYQDMGPSHPLDDVLVVGAGNGNDVAIALTHGAGHVDAVEIDPRLYQIGVQNHPNHPYADPRVAIHIADGREFLEHTAQRYDLVVFALPDSLTLVSGQASLRLESYLFTHAAMDTARAHLKSGGVFSMYNSYRETWLIDRLAGTLQTVYGHSPCLRLYGVTSAVMSDSPDAGVLHCGATWRRLSSAPIPAPADDDRPFLYLRTPGIPSVYVVTLLLIAAASVVLVRLVGGRLRPMTRFADLFFMGAAFLLLETKSVVQFALLFGTTWFVNALVFTGVLVAVLVAIEISIRWRVRRPALLYLVLLLALGVAWLVPLADVLHLDSVPRFAVACALAFTPILLANLIFAQRFRDVGDSVTAFGANLLGAMLGGILEYASLLTGYRTLLVLVAVLYGLALLSGRRPAPAL